jgi:nucleoside-diphosphate-sugar epimerase
MTSQSHDAPGHRFVVAGCGYTGLRVAARLAALGPVIAISRRLRTFEAGTLFGIESRSRDFDAEVPERLLLSDSEAPLKVVYLVPPPHQGTADPRIARFLETLPATTARVVYISTTGVYGDAGGATVTEDTPAAPATDRARRRLAAEMTLRAWCESRQIEWVILRVPGIYGPGRLPLDRLRRGEPALAEAECGPGNRIHVDDLANACVAALLQPQARNRTYNVGDGDHVSSTAFLGLLAQLAGLPPPPQLPMTALQPHKSAAALSFLGESRRVDTARLRQELGFRPRYPSAAAGIRSSLRASFEMQGRTAQDW